MLLNLLVGLPMVLLCLILQVAVMGFCVRYYFQHVARLGRAQLMSGGLKALFVLMILLMIGNFFQIFVWGLLFVQLGEFTDLYDAVFHSGVNFTSLGYGDHVMSKQWKLLGPLEAGNGILMFAMTASMIMVVLQDMIKTSVKYPGSNE
ncbi:MULTISPECIES: ion channel [Silvimonas]|uniref:ion channel n=1 Tax=Silvimonas TaxID=300264 RepID=UPI0024B3811F|nr:MULTISPECIES: ion channel [Silvimonas]MDR3428677.1 ion channel [Silvimonas sp.]